MTPNKWPEINGSSWGEISYFTLVITGFLGSNLNNEFSGSYAGFLPEFILRTAPCCTNYPRLPPRAVQEYHANQFEPAFDFDTRKSGHRGSTYPPFLNPRSSLKDWQIHESEK